MQLFVGLDVSQVLTHLCVVDPAERQVWRGKCPTDPDIQAQTIESYAGSAAKVGIEARQVHAVIPAGQVNKNARYDAKALVQLLRTGWYQAVHVKSYSSHQLRAVLGAPAQFVTMTTLSPTTSAGS